jgi:endonuclease/exonuclease/phosphatase (EEP) superfamily protein YafD
MTAPKNVLSCFATLIAFLLAGSLSALTLFSLLTARFGWKVYLEVFSHFQLQYFILALILLSPLLLLRHRWLGLVGLLSCTVLAVTQILPWYWPPAVLRPKPTPNLTVLMLNLNTQNQQFEDVLALVRREQPDLALFMEVTDEWSMRLSRLSDRLPFSSQSALAYNPGIMLLSRFELQSTEVIRFVEGSTPSLRTIVDLKGQTLTLLAAHPLVPVKIQYFHARNRQLEAMATYLRTRSSSTLVLGDLNISMWSPYYQRFVRQTGLKNARQGFGLLPTWPTAGTYPQIPDWASLILSIPIDHCLVSPDIRVVAIRTGSKVGSDHRPMLVNLAI